MQGHLILASTSRYRSALLRRLGLEFRCVAPGVDELAERGEAPAGLSLRLSREKAAAVANKYPDAVVIGSDQVASLDTQLLQKPANATRARRQLKLSSGRSVRFFTSVAVLRGAQLLGERCVATEVLFRTLTDSEINSYVEREEPFDCAGSFRWEGLGIALFEALRSDDPTALEGLPLIALTQILRSAGINPLLPPQPSPATDPA